MTAKIGIMPLHPQGTNSTFFTMCCQTAICDDQKCCPSCGREVVGCDIEDHHQRHLYRWKYAYKG